MVNRRRVITQKKINYIDVEVLSLLLQVLNLKPLMVPLIYGHV